MKLFVFLFVVLIVLVQTCLYEAKLTESSSDIDSFKHASNKRMNGFREKRLHSIWGKRSESDSDELYQRILRELYHTARLNQLAHPRYSADDDLNPLTLEQLLAQRTMWNNDNENTGENMS